MHTRSQEERLLKDKGNKENKRKKQHRRNKSSSNKNTLEALVSKIRNQTKQVATNGTQESPLQAAEAKLKEALSGGLAKKTREKYDGYLRKYIEFATHLGVEDEDMLPSKPEIVSLYIADGLGITGPGVASKKVSSIKSWHTDRGIEFIQPSNLNRIYKGIAKKWPKNQIPEELRPPITSDMINGLIHARTGGSNVQIAALAIALAAWCGLCRLGELIPESGKDVDRSRFPTRAFWQPRKRATNGRTVSSTLYLPWTKTTWAKGALIELVQQKGR